MNSDNGVGLRRLTRTLVAVVGATAVVAALAGCGFVNGGSSPSGSSKDLSIAVSTEQDAGLKDLISKFEDETGVKVKVTSAATPDLNEQLSVQLTSGTAPDVFRVSPGSSSAIGASLLGAAGKLEPLTADWVDQMPDSAHALAASGDEVFALPLSQNEIVMAYNKAVFDKLGLKVPTTWSELLDTSEALKAAGVIPISAGLTGGIYLQFLVYQLAASNVYAVNPDIDAQQKGSSTAFSSSPEWRQVFDKLQLLQTKGYLTEGANGISGDQAVQDVASGKAAMIGMVSAALPTLISAAPSASDIGVFALPGTDDASQTRLPVAPDFIAVNAASDSKQNALKLLDFLAEPDNAKAYATSLSSLPGLSVDAKTPDQLAGVADYLEKGLTVPFANYTWPNGDTQQTLLQSGQDLIAGNIDVDTLLAQLDAQFAKGTP